MTDLTFQFQRRDEYYPKCFLGPGPVPKKILYEKFRVRFLRYAGIDQSHQSRNLFKALGLVKFQHSQILRWNFLKDQLLAT